MDIETLDAAKPTLDWDSPSLTLKDDATAVVQGFLDAGNHDARNIATSVLRLARECTAELVAERDKSQLCRDAKGGVQGNENAWHPTWMRWKPNAP